MTETEWKWFAKEEAGLDLFEELSRIGELFDGRPHKVGKRPTTNFKHPKIVPLPPEGNPARKILKAERVVAQVLPFLFKDIPLTQRKENAAKVLKIHADWIVSSLADRRPIVSKFDLVTVEHGKDRLVIEHTPTKFRASGPNIEKAEDDIRRNLSGYLSRWKILTENSPGKPVLNKVNEIIEKHNLGITG